jgi:hypothetical protein
MLEVTETIDVTNRVTTLWLIGTFGGEMECLVRYDMKAEHEGCLGSPHLSGLTWLVVTRRGMTPSVSRPPVPAVRAAPVGA